MLQHTLLEEKPMTNPAWDRHSILAHLRREGMTLAALATHYGFAASSVKNIWTRPNERAERAIADFIGQPVENVSADRYPITRNRILKAEYASSRGKPSSAQRKETA